MKKGPWLFSLGFIGDEILPSYAGTITNHCKDPYNSILNNQYHGFGQESAPPKKKHGNGKSQFFIGDNNLQLVVFSIVICFVFMCEY